MKYNDTDRMVEGFGSVEAIDTQGDYVSVEKLRQLMPVYMQRGGVLMDAHTNRHIGNIVNWDMRDKDGKPAIYLYAKVFEDYSIDDMVWDAVKKKHYTGFSFGGRSTDKDVQCNTERCFNNIKDLEMWEWSLVPKPSNKESLITNINVIAKGDRMSTVLIPRIENGSVVYDAVEVPLDNEMLNKSDDAEKMDDYQAPIDTEKGDNDMTDTEKEDTNIPEDKDKEDMPMTPPAEEPENPLNKIVSMLESIEDRLTSLEGGSDVDEKAQLEEPPMMEEEEKAEAPKTVTMPLPPKQQEDKTLQKSDGDRIKELTDELKKMGYQQSTTPRPGVNPENPMDATGVTTVGSLLNKSDGALNIHDALAGTTFKELDAVFRRD